MVPPLCVFPMILTFSPAQAIAWPCALIHGSPQLKKCSFPCSQWEEGASAQSFNSVIHCLIILIRPVLITRNRYFLSLLILSNNPNILWMTHVTIMNNRYHLLKHCIKSFISYLKIFTSYSSFTPVE